MVMFENYLVNGCAIGDSGVANVDELHVLYMFARYLPPSGGLNIAQMDVPDIGPPAPNNGTLKKKKKKKKKNAFNS